MKLVDLKYDENFNVRGPIEIDDDLINLAESLKKDGFFQPVVVDQHGFLLAGYRRRRACEMAEIKDIPTRKVHCDTDAERRKVNLIENTLRTGLTRHREAMAIRDYVEQELPLRTVMTIVSRSAEWCRERMLVAILPDDLLERTDKLKKKQVLGIYKATRGMDESIIIQAFRNAVDNKKVPTGPSRPGISDIKNMFEEVTQIVGTSSPVSKALKWVLGDLEDEELMKSLGFIEDE